jgi:lipoprotein NlpI
VRRLLAFVLLVADDPPLSPAQQKAIAVEAAEALRTATELIEQDPKRVNAYSRRADARFMRGEFQEAVADYEKMVELDPSLEAGHWRRGIAYFYAGLYPKAAHQFEIYHSFDNVDRENGIWRYFSQYKALGKDKAQEGLLKYEKDDREPFPDVYQLFQGKKSAKEIVQKILKADLGAEEREKRLFYAYLYGGLHEAITGTPARAKEYLAKAVANPWGPKSGFGPNYMWHVGRLQYDLVSK